MLFRSKIGIDEEGRKYQDKIVKKTGKVYRYYLDEGKIPEDVWQIQSIQSQSEERLRYPTQKPELLLERIIKASTDKGDLVADFFCGCGTTIAVAEKLNRNWIGVDISHLAIRLIINERLINTYGREIRKSFEVDGFPEDIASAKELATGTKKGRLKFEGWIIEVMLHGVLNTQRNRTGFDGYLTFDNHGFNPYLDISANTIIDGERIDISIIGMIDNPVLTFTSEHGFSQSDILELLTWRKKFEEQDLSSTEIGTQASDIVFSWFGNQLDRNILELSGLNRLSILENVDLHGTTGLLTAGKDFSISAPLTDNISINYAYRRSFGLVDSYHSLGVELRLNRNLSLVGNIDRSGYMHIKYRLRYAY